MNVGLLTSIILSALVSVAQAAPESTGASGPLLLTAPQMDAATAGMAGVWITSAASGIELSGSKGFGHAASIGTVPDYAGICCGSNANIQLVFKISGLSSSHSSDSSNGVIMSSPEGTTMSSGETIFKRNIQIR